MVVQEAMKADRTDQKYIDKKGWIPWFSENHLFLLGWVQRAGLWFVREVWQTVIQFVDPGLFHSIHDTLQKRWIRLSEVHFVLLSCVTVSP